MFLIITCKPMYSSAKCCAYGLAQNTSMYSTSTIKFTALLHDICLQSCTSCIMYTHKHFLVASFLRFVFSILCALYWMQTEEQKWGRPGNKANFIILRTCSTSLWLAFLANVQQGRVLERGFLALNSMSTRVMPTGNIPEASEIRMPPYYRHTAGSLYGVCIRAAPL